MRTSPSVARIRSRSARQKSSGVVSLTLPARLGRCATVMPAHSISAASSVKSSRPARRRAGALRARWREWKRLRRLHRRAARRGRASRRPGRRVHPLDRVGDRQVRDRRRRLAEQPRSRASTSAARRTGARRRGRARCPAHVGRAPRARLRTEACRVAPPGTGRQQIGRPATASRKRRRHRCG